MSTLFRAFAEAKQFSSAFWWLCAATLFNQFGNMAAVFLIIYLHEHLRWSVAKSSSAFAVEALFLVLSGLLAGKWIDRLGGRFVILTALMSNAIILFCFSQLENSYLIFLFCAAWGLAYGCYRPASQSLVSNFSSSNQHQFAFSIYRFFINLGMSVGPVVGGYLAQFHFSWIFIINAAANFSAVIIIWYGLPKVKKTREDLHLNQQKKIGSFQVIKSDPYLLWCLIAMIPISMVFFQFESTLVVYIHNYLNLPLSFYGFLLTINTGLIVLLEIPINIFTANWSMRANLMLGSALFAIGFGGYYFAHTQNAVMMLAVIWTFGEMILFPASTAYIAKLSSAENRGSYMGAFATSTNLGLLLGPWLGGMAFNEIGVPYFWAVVGLLGCISCILFYVQPMRA